MNSNLLKWGLAGLLLVSAVGNAFLWQRSKALQAQSQQLSVLQSQLLEVQEQASQVDQLKVDYEELQKLRRDMVELARLRNETAQSRAAVPEMAKLQAQLTQLTQQLKAAREALTDQQSSMEAEVETSVQSALAFEKTWNLCMNNMKQIGLGIRMWAQDHNDVLPASLVVLQNELNSAELLTCPGDTTRNPVEDWQQLGPLSISYQYLLPNAPQAELAVDQPMTSCPIHGNVGMADGSVQRPSVPAQP